MIRKTSKGYIVVDRNGEKIAGPYKTIIDRSDIARKRIKAIK